MDRLGCARKFDCCLQVKSAPEAIEQKTGLQEKQPLARISLEDFFTKLRRKISPPPKSAADLGFLKKDLRKLGSFLGGGEAKAADLQVCSLFLQILSHAMLA